MNTHPFTEKLLRLTVPVKELSFAGADLSSYEHLPVVAIVGTRKPTPYGKIITQKLAEDLARTGVVVVSGLALGTDGIAHESVLDAGGRTIAVLPGGVQTVYPATNRSIADRIVKQNGTLISEYPLNHRPRKVEFLERNRIIAALSDVVIIPEAAGNSGSLNTAKHALRMGIPVCVFPGNITSPMSVGTNHLLKNGALAITDANDVLNLLDINTELNKQSLDLIGDNPQETLVLQKINSGFTESNDLQIETLLSASDLLSTVTMLEVQGRVAQDSSGSWRLL